MLHSLEKSPKLIWVSVAELSGDIHAADLVKSLVTFCPGLKFRGIAGPSLRGQLRSQVNEERCSEGEVVCSQELQFSALFGIEQLSVMGGTEVLSILPRILKMWSLIKRDLQETRPDAVVLVDGPDFNFKIAKMAYRLGIPVYYYISPKIWAWRSGRANFLKKYTRKVISILPFEKDFYKSFGMDVPYVGNPLVSAMNLPELDKLEVVPGRIGLMPGSRNKEVKTLMPLFGKAAEMIVEKQPGLFFHCIQSPGISGDMLNSLWQSSIPLKLEPAVDRYRFMRSCECILAASGTATLECALAGTPTVVTYKLSALTGYLASKVINVKYVSLPNLILNRKIFPELLQKDAKPELMASHILEWLNKSNFQAKQAMQADLQELRKRLGSMSAPAEAAKLILKDISSISCD